MTSITTTTPRPNKPLEYCYQFKSSGGFALHGTGASHSPPAKIFENAKLEAVNLIPGIKEEIGHMTEWYIVSCNDSINEMGFDFV